MVSNIMDHFDNHNILFHNQHGFRGKLSCETQLIQLTDDIAHTLDRRKQADLLIWYFSLRQGAPPQSRSQTRLVRRSQQEPRLDHGLPGIQDPMSAAGRRDLNTESSHKGVPPGTVLGPVLFMAYINDLHESITNSNVRLFADDCVLYRDITDRNDTDLLQQDIDAKWLMELNVDKCFVMHASHSKHQIQHQYTIHNQTLTPVKTLQIPGSNPLRRPNLAHPHIQRSR